MKCKQCEAEMKKLSDHNYDGVHYSWYECTKCKHVSIKKESKK